MLYSGRADTRTGVAPDRLSHAGWPSFLEIPASDVLSPAFAEIFSGSALLEGCRDSSSREFLERPGAGYRPRLRQFFEWQAALPAGAQAAKASVRGARFITTE